VAGIAVRGAVPADLPQIAAVALATGQDEEWGGGGCGRAMLARLWPGAVAAVLTVLAYLEPPDGRALVCLPAPHPAVRALLAAGWRIEDHDLFMATDQALLDPRRPVPSPALG
jgi:hypothetical protein